MRRVVRIVGMAPRTTDEQAALVARARAGDYDAFAALVDAHAGGVYALARRIVRQDQDAEDVVQTAFIAALEHLDGFREDASFKTWLHRIATNAALKVLRKRRGLPLAAPLGGTGDEDQPLPMPERIADWRADVGRAVENREFRALLEDAIDRLDEKYRLVFILRDIEELNVKETADQLGITESNVKVRLMRARLQLREVLSRALGVGPDLKPDHAHPH